MAILTGGQAVTLEYLGVSIHFRRLGYGRALLREALTTAHLRNTESTSGTASLTAWCDVDNAPGMQFYQDSGFAPAAIGHLWIYTIEPKS